MESLESNKVRDVNFFAQNAAIGQFISVEIANANRESFKTHLVGCKAGSYLILEIPNVQDAGIAKKQLVLDQPLIIRTICERTTGECMGFYSSVLGIVRIPYPVFFAAYPEEVETRELRTEKRLSTTIPCQMFLQQGGEEMPGYITDLSSGGCRFELQVRDDVVKVKVNTMYLRFLDPATSQPTVRLGSVCSQRKIGNMLSIGFAFMQQMQQSA
ncbi:MAG TPA: flagellar brake protein [Candidatus Acidoferrum sp.]|nr:flagellar brake protein [Candidatus Acidoferrum sp.]